MFRTSDCSSSHFCQEMLDVVNTDADLSMVTALPTYASVTAFDFVTAFTTRDFNSFLIDYPVPWYSRQSICP